MANKQLSSEVDSRSAVTKQVGDTDFEIAFVEKRSN